MNQNYLLSIAPQANHKGLFWVKATTYKFFCSITVLSFMLFLSFNQTCLAHGDLDERIAEVSQEIKTTPDSSYLYFKRGKLHFQHEEYPKAIEDLQKANQLGYDDLFCDLIYAKSFQKLEKYDEALQYIDKIQLKKENNVIALKTKAEILFAQKKYESSAITFEKVIDFSRKRLPENYLAAAKSWEAINTKNGNENATAIVQKGIDDLGTIFIFQEAMREMSIRFKDYPQALAVQEKIIAAANRKEMTYYKAAEICLLAKDKTAAKKYLQLSLTALKKLPPHKKNITAMVTLKEDVMQLLKTL